MKFSALNLDYDGPSLDFLGLRKLAHEGIKQLYARKIYFLITLPLLFLPLFASLS